MAEIEVTGVAIPEDSPEWFRYWATQTKTRILKLFRSLSTLTLDNLSSVVFPLSVAHGKTITIRHEIGREPAFVTYGSGRISHFQLVSSSLTQVSLTPSLVSTITVETSDKLKNRITVADSSIFKVKDLVQIDGAERKIQNIAGNVLTLSDKVDLRTQKTVTLARDVVTFLIL